MILIARALRGAIVAVGLIPFAANLFAANAEPLTGCYERHYDAKHLTAHPSQRVHDVMLSLKPMTGNNPWVASANLKMAILGHKGLVSVGGDCTKDSHSLTCAGVCDTGSFRLVSTGQGNVTLSITDRLLLQRSGCDDESYVEQKPDKENTQFLLKPAKASACK